MEGDIAQRGHGGRRGEAVKVAKIAGYVAWFFFAFFVGLIVTFPVDGLRGIIVTEAEKALGKGKQGVHGVDPVVSIGSLSMSGLGLSAESVSVQLASRDPDPGPTILIDEVWASVSLLSLLTTEKTFEVEAELYGGDVSVDVSVDEKQVVREAEITIDDVDLSKLQLLQGYLGAPVSGLVNAKVSLDMGKTPEKDANGDIELDVKGLALGPGNLKPVPGGFDLPEVIALGDLVGRIPVKQGQGTIEKLHFEGAPQVEAEVQGTLNIKGRLLLSRLDAEGWFKPTSTFLDKNPKIKSALELAEKFSMPGAPSLSKAKDDDGRYHFSLRGALQNLQPQLARDNGRRALSKGKGPVAPTPTARPTPRPTSPPPMPAPASPTPAEAPPLPEPKEPLQPVEPVDEAPLAPPPESLPEGSD